MQVKVLLTVVTCFKYLGINFHSTTCIAGAAAPAQTQAARAALHDCRARCAALGVESAPAQLRLFSALVESKLSCGAEVWGMQLAAKAAAAGGGSTRCAAEKLHLGYLRQLLGVRQSTPNAVVLAETGVRPLWARWLLRTTRLWKRALAAPEDSLLRQAVMTSAALATAPGSRTSARQPWAQQLAAALIAAGVELDLSKPQPISREAVRNCCAQQQLEQLLTAADNPAATKDPALRHRRAGRHPRRNQPLHTCGLPDSGASALPVRGAGAVAYRLPLGRRGDREMAGPQPRAPGVPTLQRRH